ncbi:MAG: class I SAM-dependent methyltransferase [Candidatus Paceibacterota bacterium]|jgi:SAM-dependent methyltransferase
MPNPRETEIISFYNKESESYSRKRYLGAPKSYTQYFFQNRLAITLRLLAKYVSGKKDMKLIDIACADGVMTRAVSQRFPENFSALVGTDISIDMIETAKRITTDPKISFFVKDNQVFPNAGMEGSFDIALGLGYLAPAIYEGEMAFLKQYIKKDGIYMTSLAAHDSIHARLKLRDAEYRKDYVSYAKYEIMLRKHFHIIKKIPNGLFVPKLWAIPVLGRTLQPLADIVFRHIIPGLFHEMIYVLRLK